MNNIETKRDRFFGGERGEVDKTRLGKEAHGPRFQGHKTANIFI